MQHRQMPTPRKINQFNPRRKNRCNTCENIRGLALRQVGLFALVRKAPLLALPGGRARPLSLSLLIAAYLKKTFPTPSCSILPP